MDWKMINTIVPPSQLNIDYFGANERNALECLHSVGTHIKCKRKHQVNKKKFMAKIKNIDD